MICLPFGSLFVESPLVRFLHFTYSMNSSLVTLVSSGTLVDQKMNFLKEAQFRCGVRCQTALSLAVLPVPNVFLTFSVLVANPKKTTLHGGKTR